MSPSNTKVIPSDARNVICAGTHVGPAETADVGSANASDVTTPEASHMTPAKAAAHVAATPTATMAAAATATAGLCARGNKAAGKQSCCQNHRQSSLHDLSPLGWADIPPQGLR
jgi:hypothetical protein